jgi:glucokinase
MGTTFMRLLGDVGGTHIRLACQSGVGAPLQNIRVLQCLDYPSIEAAIKAYLQMVGVPALHAMALAIANPVTDDRIQMTNHHWSFSSQALVDHFNVKTWVILNDFQALALSLPYLLPSDLKQIGGQSPVQSSTVALIGPGTGLGVSGLLAQGELGPLVALAGEGGHVTLAAETPLEFDVLNCVRRQHGHVSAERILSGPGLVNLYNALRELHASQAPVLSQASQIAHQALQLNEALALQALNLFCGFLGNMAGNLALTLGARGGVYIGGGMVPRWGAWFEQSPFRSRFESKGRFKTYLENIPCWVIAATVSPALLGAAQALDQKTSKIL